jgi:hypothetical protein
MAIKMKNNPPSPYQHKSLHDPSPLRIVFIVLSLLATVFAGAAFANYLYL